MISGTLTALMVTESRFNKPLGISSNCRLIFPEVIYYNGGYLWGLPNNSILLCDGGYLISYYNYMMGATYGGYLITQYYYVMGAT